MTKVYLRGVELPSVMMPQNDGTTSAVVAIRARDLAKIMGYNGVYDSANDTYHVDKDTVQNTPTPTVPDWHKVLDPDLKPWLVWEAPITSDKNHRYAPLLEAVIKQCGVATAPRYRRNQAGADETYCNIFLWDVTRALGAEIPHWVDSNLAPCAVGKGRELDANGCVDWLMTAGSAHGWRSSNADMALNYANAGKPAVAVWKNVGGIGHVAIVRPGEFNAARGVPTAQAGGTNFDNGYLKDGFGTRAAIYYVHD